tara:strand:+ start:4513 stop:4761 length:249 start_codon:yes stop_codon:yes gene_type:complete
MSNEFMKKLGFYLWAHFAWDLEENLEQYDIYTRINMYNNFTVSVCKKNRKDIIIYKGYDTVFEGSVTEKELPGLLKQINDGI